MAETTPVLRGLSPVAGNSLTARLQSG